MSWKACCLIIADHGMIDTTGTVLLFVICQVQVFLKDEPVGKNHE